MLLDSVFHRHTVHFSPPAFCLMLCRLMWKGQGEDSVTARGRLDDREESGWFSRSSTIQRPYLLQPQGVILHGALQILQLPLLPGRPLFLGLSLLGLTYVGFHLWRGVPLEGVSDLKVLQGMAVLHLGEYEGVAAGAVLHVVLLAIWADRGGQQVGQVGNGQGQQAAHVRGKRGEGEGGLRGEEKACSTWQSRQVWVFSLWSSISLTFPRLLLQCPSRF